MIQTSDRFKEHVTRALADDDLKIALSRTTGLLQARRRQVIDEYAEYGAARERAGAIKDHTLAHLDHYLEMFETNARANGATVHWAKTPEAARRIVTKICTQAGAKTATRVKSMLGEEIGIAQALSDAGVERIETDLAEHIIQLAQDPPSHIVMPAMHKTHEQVAQLFDDLHDIAPDTHDIPDLVGSARRELRQKFLSADVSISGANFLIADTGATVTVTNEGNSELTCTPPKVHIVTAGIEKLVPGMAHASVFLRLLARAAIGAEITQYTTFYNGPKRSGDADGPEAYHIVLVDNHRSEMLGSDLQAMLKCIRCGACMNHCPVYAAIGGHAYGAVYPGPMGSVLTPALSSLKAAKDLPNACTLNGRCKEVCPVNIPLPDMLRNLRARQWEAKLASPVTKLALGAWRFVARRPKLYHFATGMAVFGMRLLSLGRTRIRRMPMAGGWVKYRDLPRPEKGSFMQQYKASKHAGEKRP
ncbi:Lactate utilization protein B [Roseobacter fucihabitans]|uniref:Lactate utilization protein B n=1 Tax=Roseobacter fucihabitans TaxID=1537242 RepID=A0ABZ2BWP0_9RHOB|nr:lactate utilization protein B [Roseobacter litoralis]MBC6967357.1 Lactate utilization protein B [Roseobacter litoralis]